MNILFLFCSLPDLSNKQGLWASLIHEFAANGHHVLVSSKGKGKKDTELCVEAGISVLRIGGPEFTAVPNNVKKALAYQQYILKQQYYVNKYWGKEKIDLIISHSLPPELAYVVGGLKKHFKCPFYLIQSDYTWQDAVAYGFFGGKSIIARYYQFWERKAFKLADYIGVPTKGNVRFARQLYPWLKEELFSVYPFWQRTMGVEKGSEIKEKYGLAGKFVVMYGGNVGPAQRVENLVSLAEQVQDYKDIVFLILGKGSRLPVIQQMVVEKHLENVVFKDFLPQQDYLQLLAACDAGLIMLNEVHATPNFPSKTMSYFDLQIPVLAAIDRITDFGQFLEETGTGMWSYSGDTETFKKNLLRLYQDSELVASIKENEKEYFKQYMQPEYAYTTIMNQIGTK
jgi:glycosyltransferase involved in cell wall biosynthesis